MLVVLGHVNVTVRQAAFEDHGTALSVVMRLVLRLLVQCVISFLFSAGHLRLTQEFGIGLQDLYAAKRDLARSLLNALQVCLLAVHVRWLARAGIGFGAEKHLLLLGGHLLLGQ